MLILHVFYLFALMLEPTVFIFHVFYLCFLMLETRMLIFHDLLSVFSRYDCVHIRVFRLGPWEGSQEALGDAWGIIEGQLGDFRSILDKSRERMRTCDVI